MLRSNNSEGKRFGVAEGTVLKQPTLEYCYKCDELYHPEDEGGIIWNDPEISIEWPFGGEPLLSEKDMSHKSLKETNMYFVK